MGLKTNFLALIVIVCLEVIFEYPTFSVSLEAKRRPAGDASKTPIEKLNVLDVLLQDVVPTITGEASSNANGSEAQFKDFEFREHENDVAISMSTEELIRRAKFKYETYYAIARDGYITKLLRIVNPKVKRENLKWPPTVLLHGGTIDTTCFVFSSTSRHHPEKYPRTIHDPYTSWNRSLAFVLANGGYDVWLPSTRGSSQIEADHVKLHSKENLEKELAERHAEDHNNDILWEQRLARKLNKIKYWDFTQDDIIKHEIKAQLDEVIRVASQDWPSKHHRQHPKVNFLGFSLSVPLALGFFAEYPTYTAEHINSFVALGPVVTGKALGPVAKLVLATLCPLVPYQIGTEFTKFFTSIANHKFTEILVKSKAFRYTIVKAIAVILYGPSAKYLSLIEQNVVGHLVRSFGFKEAKQMCQQLNANRIQKYDYGPFMNHRIYGSRRPPEYDLMHSKLKSWAFVGTHRDTLAGPKALKFMKEKIRPLPVREIIATKFDHFDIIAGLENGRKINIPILKYFDSVSFERDFSGN